TQAPAPRTSAAGSARSAGPATPGEEVAQEVIQVAECELLPTRPPGPGPSATETLAERLAGAPGGLGIKARFERDVAELVVGSTLFRVGEGRIGLRNCLKAFLGRLVSGIHVGMMLARELAIGLANCVLVGVSRDSEHFVGILAAAARGGVSHVRVSPDARVARA